MVDKEPENSIYNTRSPGDKEPEREYAELELTKAKTVTRNKILNGILLGGTTLVFAIWLAITYRGPDRDRNRDDGLEFEPELISLQQGVEITATGSTNSLADRFDVSSYLPEGWGTVPNTDELSDPSIQVLNPVIQTPSKPTGLIIETNDVPTLLAQVAEKFIREGKLKLAEDQLKVALDQRPDDANCLHLLGTIYTTRGEHDKAIAHYTELITKNPYKEDYYNNLAVAYIRSGKLDKAEKTLKEALTNNGKYYDAHLNLAILYRQKERNDLVVKQLGPIIGDMPTNTTARKHLAHALLAIGEPYRARAHFVELVRLVPEEGSYYLKVAECYAQEDLPKKAAAWLKLATDHASELDIKKALLEPPFQRLKDERSIRLFINSLDTNS